MTFVAGRFCLNCGEDLTVLRIAACCDNPIDPVFVHIPDEQTVEAIMKTDWQPMSTAPKKGRILGWCVHSADPYHDPVSPAFLTTYAAHVEGLGRVSDGPHVLEWGGEYHETEVFGKDVYIPDWWFRAGSEFEEAANPIYWAPILEDPTK